MLQHSWIFYLYTISILNGIKSTELAVSSKNALFFLSDSQDEIRKQLLPSTILALGTDHDGKVAVIQNANSVSQLKMTSYSSTSSLNHSSNYFPLINGVTKVLPDPVNGDRNFIANKSQLILEQDETLTKAYQGQSIQDVSIDYCQEALFLVDQGSLFRSNLSTIELAENNRFHAFLPSDHNVLLVTNQVYLARNLEISHSDGFVIKSLISGFEICQSDPSKSFNIRAISLNKNQLFMLDALNSVVWNLNLAKAKSNAICDLSLWKRVPRNEQLLDLVVLNRSIDCISISHQDQRNQYLSQPETSTLITSSANEDPCLNFCFHGDCKLTTLNKPHCYCQQNFTGKRCEVDICYNYCLNNGVCSVSSTEVSTFEVLRRCQCPQGFSGSRCQLKEETEISHNFNYEHAFLVTSSLCVVFTFILLAISIFLIRSRRPEKGPEVIKKNGRARVFSTSSNSDGKRSRNMSKSTNPRSAGAVNEAFGNAQDNCVDDQGHMCQALISDDGVVLDLEDCCNMTVCDKPCIEAAFRKPTSRKKQDKILLSPDELY